ncbi:MAG: hypothetical protein EOP09_01825 [Proteobacteria bacterium]|nr:MAG: hypothetical protein EOP09_01825 [Pseudomonadota bacterium]
MKSILFATLVLTFLSSACSPRPVRPVLKKSGGAAADVGPSKPESYPAFVDSNDPLDSYLSIGPYLQKEFDAADSANKTVKVYMQIRQENSIEKNFADLKVSMGKLHASVVPALEAAQKKGDTTVEFDAEVGSLKTTVATLNKAVSGIEISLPTVK